MDLIRKLLSRMMSRQRRDPHTGPDLEIAAALAGILPDAEPNPDLFQQIEASLDDGPARKTSRRKRALLLPTALGMGLGLVLAAVIAVAALDAQRIVTKPSAEAPWLPLGAVTLHGSDLRAFVRARCQGHTHLSITLKGQTAVSGADIYGQGTPLMGGGEIILMDCIF